MDLNDISFPAELSLATMPATYHAPRGEKRKHSDDETPSAAGPDKKTDSARTIAEAAPSQAQPGDPSDAASFYQVHKVEVVLAPYLGFDSIRDLRRFCVSHFFLEHFLRYRTEDKWATKGPVEAALEKIRDEFLRPGADKSEYPLNPQDLTKLHPRKPSRDYFVTLAERDAEFFEMKKSAMAYLLILMVEDLDNKPDASIDPQLQQNNTAKLQRVAPWIKALPDVGEGPIKFPKFKTDFVESDLEAYNRALNLLKYAQRKFTRGYWVRNGFHPEIGKKCRDQDKPMWMRTQSAEDHDDGEDGEDASSGEIDEEEQDDEEDDIPQATFGRAARMGLRAARLNFPPPRTRTRRRVNENNEQPDPVTTVHSPEQSLESYEFPSVPSTLPTPSARRATVVDLGDASDSEDEMQVDQPIAEPGAYEATGDVTEQEQGPYTPDPQDDQRETVENSEAVVDLTTPEPDVNVKQEAIDNLKQEDFDDGERRDSVLDPERDVNGEDEDEDEELQLQEAELELKIIQLKRKRAARKRARQG